MLKVAALGCLTLLGIGLLGTAGALESGEDWAIRETKRLTSTTPSLSNVVEDHWYQIPASDLTAHGVSRDWYFRTVKPKLDAFATSAAAAIEQDVQKAFANLKFEDLQERHHKGQSIDYCSWIQQTRPDGAIMASGDLQMVVAGYCRDLARERIKQLLADRANSIRIELGALPVFNFEFPRWLIADAGINGLESQHEYLDVLVRRFDQAKPDLLQEINRSISSRAWDGRALPGPKHLCGDLLGRAVAHPGAAEDSFEPIRKALTTRCRDQATAWIISLQPDVLNTVKAAFGKIDPSAPIRSERRLCADILGQRLTDDDYPADFTQAVHDFCATQAKTTVAALIEQKAQALADRTNGLPATFDALQRSAWFGLSNAQFVSLVASDDLDHQSTIERIVGVYVGRIDAHGRAAVADAKRVIRSAFDAAIGKQSMAASKDQICGSNGSGTSLPPAPQLGPKYRDEVAAFCVEQTKAFTQKRVQFALDHSGVQSLDKALILSPDENSSDTVDPRTLVAAASISGLQVAFKKGWADVAIGITPIGADQPRLDGRLSISHGKSNLRLENLDSFPQFPAAPGETLACLVQTQDDANAQAFVAAFAFLGSLFADDYDGTSGHLMKHALSGVLNTAAIQQCLTARRAFANS